MRETVFVNPGSIGSDLGRLVHALEPSDLAAIEAAAKHWDRSARGVYGIHAVLSQLFGLQQQPRPAPVDATELNDLEAVVMRLEDAVARQGVAIDALCEEVAGLHRLALGQAERIAAQSEMLARRAEAAAPPAEALPEPAPVPPAPEPRPDPNGEPDPSPPQPSANGRGCHMAAAALQRRLEVAKLLAVRGQLSSRAAAEALGIPDGSITGLLKCDWFAKTDPADRYAPWSLTDAGRKALAESGHVLVPPAVEAIASVAETPAPEPASPKQAAAAPAHPTLLPKGDRTREQCREIALAIVEAGADPLTADQIANRAGLPVDVVNKRLNRYGPSSLGGVRYFSKSERHPGCWRVTNSGEALAKEAAPV